MLPSDRLHRNGFKHFVPTRKLAVTGLCAFLGIALALSACWALEDKPAEAVEDPGLRGILPQDVPLDLTSDAFGILGGNWQKWGTELAETIEKLYTGENLDKKAQGDLIATLQKRLKTIDTSLADSRFRSIHDPLTSIRSRLARRVDFAAAAMETLDLDPADVHKAHVAAEGKKVAPAVEALRTEVTKVAGGTAWLGYVRADEIVRLMAKPEDSEKAVPVLQAVRDKLAARESLKDEAQKKFLSRPGFVGLEQSIDAYLAAVNEPPKTVDMQALRDGLGKLAQGIEMYEETGLSADAAQIPGLLDGVSKVAADNGRRLGSVVRLHYLNSNLQLVANEAFLSRIVHETRNESGQIVDAVPGANVRGTQSTTTVVSIDTKPSAGPSGLLNLTLSGRTSSNTSAYSSQAVIYSTGDSQFWATKPLWFDGYSVRTSPANITVNSNVYNYNATVYGYESGLFSGTATSRALGVANSRRGEAIAHAQTRVRENVLPRFESESEKAMKDLDASLQRFDKRLKEAKVFPEKTYVATSESAMRMQSTVRADGELAGDAPPSAYNPADDALLEVHESLLNNVFSRMNLAGKTMTDEDVRKEIERFLTIIAGKEVKLESTDAAKKTGDAAQKTEEEPAAEGEPRAFIFADKDPIRVEFEDGEIRLIIRAGFEQPGKENIPLQQVTVPLIYKVQGDKVAIETGGVKVSPVDKPASTAQQLGFAGVIKKKIEKSIPNRTREAKLNMEREGKPPVVLSVTDIKALGGWLIVRIR